MSTLDTLWFRLIPLTVWMAIAALIVQALIWIVRPTSPQTHRIAWACVLISGLLFVRIPINLPDHRLDLIAATQAKTIVDPLFNPAPQSHAPMSDPRTAVPGPSSAPVSPAREDRTRLPQLGVRIESEVSAVPVATLRPLLQSAWRPIALLAWGLGTAVVLGMGALSYIRFVRRVRRFEPASGDWAREWCELLHERRVGRQITLVVSESSGPALCLLPAGYHVIVPMSLWSTLSATERTAILRHELAHYERGDLLKSLFARLVVAVHWINPTAWWARRQFEAAGEWACDDQATGRCGAVAFAKTLMRLAGIQFPSIPLTDSIGTGALYSRIRRLLLAPSVVDVRWKKNLINAVSVGVVTLTFVRINRIAEATSPSSNLVVASRKADSQTRLQLAVLAAPSNAPKAGTARVDQFGDPLPLGAVMCLGTTRLRHSSTQTAFSPNGKIIASLGSDSIALWDRTTGKLIRTLQDTIGDYRHQLAFAFAPDGMRLVCVGIINERLESSPCVWLWDVAGEKKLWSAKIDGRGEMTAVAYSPDGTTVAAGGPRGPAILLDVSSGKTIREFGERVSQFSISRRTTIRSLGDIGPVAYSPDGRTLITFQERESLIRLWDIKSGEQRTSIGVPQELEILSLITSADGKQLIAGGSRKVSAAKLGRPYFYANAYLPEIRYWDILTGELVRKLSFEQPTLGGGAMSLAKNQKTIAWSVNDRISIWDAVAGKPIKDLPLPQSWGFQAPCISPDATLVAASDGDTIAIWDIASGARMPADLRNYFTSVSAAEYSPDGKSIYSSGLRGQFTAWNAATGQIRFQGSRDAHSMMPIIDVSADGKLVATGEVKEVSATAIICAGTIWNARTGERIREFHDPTRPRHQIIQIAISPDSRLLAICGKNVKLRNQAEVELWEIETGKMIAVFRADDSALGMCCLRFTPDSKSLYGVSATSHVERWNATTGTLEKTFVVAERPPKAHKVTWTVAATITPDFRTLVTSDGRSLFSWNLDTGELESVIAESSPHEDFGGLAVSRDGRFLAVGVVKLKTVQGGHGAYGVGNAVRVFDRTSAQEVQRLEEAGTRPVFSPDGTCVISMRSNGTAVVWELIRTPRPSTR